MTPSTDEIAILDAMIAESDAAEGLEPPATRSYAVIFAEWTRFIAFVASLDTAVRAPLVEGASSVLSAAERLVEQPVHNLAFALTHTGEAIDRHRKAG